MRRAAVWVLHIGSCMDASLPEPLRLKEIPVILNGGSGDGHGDEEAKRLEGAFREAGLEPRLLAIRAGGGGGGGGGRGAAAGPGGGGRGRDAERGGGRCARNRNSARRDPGRDDESLRQGPGDSPGPGRGRASDWHRTVHSRG